MLAGLTPDRIKLDMALVRNVDTSKSRQAIARGVLRLCQGLGIQVIAEGVESAAKRDSFVREGVENRKFKRPFSRPCRLVKAVGRACYGLWSRLRRLGASTVPPRRVRHGDRLRVSFGKPWLMANGICARTRYLTGVRDGINNVPDSSRPEPISAGPRNNTVAAHPRQTRCTSRRCAVPSARKTCKAWLGMPSGNVSPTATRSSPVLASSVLSVPPSLA